MGAPVAYVGMGGAVSLEVFLFLAPHSWSPVHWRGAHPIVPATSAQRERDEP